MTNEHITASATVTFTTGRKAEWYVIHAGKELGPLTLDELLEKAAAGEIGAGDLVKQAGGLWIKVQEFEFLREQVRLRASRQEAIERLGRFDGIWLSKKTLVVVGCTMLFVVCGAIPWAIRKPTKDNVVVGNEKTRENVQKPEQEKPALEPAKDARFFTDRGAEWFRNGDDNNAIKDFNEAIRLDPTYPDAYIGRGNAWLRKWENDIALKDFDEAVRLDPHRSEAYSGRGRAWFLKRDYDRAIQNSNEAIRLNPNEALNYYCRGSA